MPEHGSQPSAQAPAAAVSRELRQPLAVNNPCAVQLDINGIDHFLGVGLGLGQMSGDALHVGTMLLVKFPPGPFITIGTCERHKKIVRLDRANEFTDVL